MKRKIYYLAMMMLTLVVAPILTTSCEEKTPVEVVDPNEDPNIEPDEKPQPVESPFEIDLVGETAYDYSVMVNYNSDEVESQYMIALITNDDYQEQMNSSAQEFAQAVIEEAKDNDVDFGSVDNKYIFDKPSKIDIAATWDVEPSESYAFLVFGVSNYGEITAEPAVLATELSSELPTPFEVKVVGESANSISIDVDPVSGLGNYYIGVVTLEEYEGSEFNSDPQALAEHFVFDEFPGLDYDKVNNERVFEGKQTIALKCGWGFVSDTEYVICVYGVEGDVKYDSDDYLILNSVMTTDPIIVTAKTKEASTAPFEIEITGATYEDLYYKVTTKGYDGIYYTGGCTMASFVSDYDSNIEKAAQGSIKIEDQYYIDFTKIDGESIVQGDSDEINLSDSWMVRPETEYVIFAVGIDEEGNMTTSVGYNTGTTGPVEQSDMTINIAISDVTEYSATLTFTPSERRYYLFQLVSKEYYDSFASEQELQEYLIDYIFVEENSDRAYTDVEEKSVTYYNLYPDQEYVALAFGVYPTTLESITKVFKYEFNTSQMEDPGVQFPDAESLVLSSKEFGELEIVDVESSQFTFNATPKDPDLRYLVMTTTKEEFDKYDTTEELILADFEWIEKASKNLQAKVVETVEALSYTGNSVEEVVDRLPGGTELAVYAYGISLGDLQPTTDLVYAFCTTKGSSTSYDDYSYVAPKVMTYPNEYRALGIENINPLTGMIRW